MERKREWVDLDYEEQVRSQIDALPDTVRGAMAKLVLQGVIFKCAPQSGLGMNRWWTVYGPSGEHWQGIGGAVLTNVVNRAKAEAEIRRRKEQW